MINVLSVSGTRAAEKAAMQSGVAESELIERAAEKLFGAVAAKEESNGKILVVYGGGNNGADGLSAAALLKESGRNVSVCFVGEKKNVNVTQREKRCAGLGVIWISPADSFAGYSLIVDAVFGVGLCREIGGAAKEAVGKINASGAYVICADVPTGLDADGGFIHGACVNADETVAFSCLKTGLLINDAKNYIGRLTVADIGIAPQTDMQLIEETDIKLLPRKAAGHKYDNGKVAIIGGSPKMPGAALMAHEASAAALKSGAGLSVLCVPYNMAAAYQCRVKEVMLDFIKSDDDGIVFDPESLARITAKTSAVAIGPGMVPNAALRETVLWLCENFGGTLVLDAGALAVAAKDIKIIEKRKCKLILTPHVGEFDRLCPGDKKELVLRVKTFSETYGCVTVCKGAVSIVSDGTRTLFCDFGTPALGKGGSGDVLCGIVCALAARYCTLDAALYGCYFLGRAARLAEKELSVDSVIASDIILKI